MRVRIYELARQLNIDSKSLVDLCRQAGLDVKNQLSPITGDQMKLLAPRLKMTSSGLMKLFRLPVPNPPAEMLFYKFAPELLEGWKNYPVRICGPCPSECHGTPTLLVQSMTGGFVTANCAECGKKHSLSQGGFFSLSLWVSCPRCRAKMRPEMLSRVKGRSRLAANYGYVCSQCRIYVLLADLLPRWEDVV